MTSFKRGRVAGEMEERGRALSQPALNNTFPKRETRTNLPLEDKSVRGDSNGFANNETIQRNHAETAEYLQMTQNNIAERSI